ncbi:MAG: GNAT family N-acetyltransferase [Microvirga sp.]
MAAIKVEKIYGPARREILKGLLAFNKRALGNWNFKPLSITLRHRGAIVGGLYGETYLNWMYISLFWLADEFRGKGFGSKIMQTAEKEARKRGVKNAFVDSFSFQAPGFYKKLGYREFGRLEAYPEGHHRAWMTKAL